MFNFFAAANMRTENGYMISGGDYNHIKNVLRKNVGDKFLVSDNGESHLCEIEKIEEDFILVKIIERNYNDTSLPIELYLFEGLPKADKLELIIQKAVELGVSGIIPVEMENCVVKLDQKKKSTKLSRWQSIAEAAAKQSKRNIIPTVFPVTEYKTVLENINKLDLLLVPYECAEGMKSTKNALLKLKKGMKIGILIGPEGGFSLNEIEKAKSSGAEIISLGKRILRTETAAITALSMCMLYSETELTDD